MNILIITRTNWGEPPRIRHQLSRLFRDMGGNRVFYVDIRSSLRDFGLNKWNNEGIDFYSFSELIHHQLRPFKFIREIHKSIVKKKLSIIARRHEFDLVINFNYDLCFLKEIFLGSQVITMLNDNFYLQAWPWMKRAIGKQVAHTAAVSDAVMTVSYPLVDLLSPFNINTYLLLPWAQIQYSKPENKLFRPRVLYFGYIDNRLDHQLLDFLIDNNVLIDFVGPVRKHTPKIKKLQVRNGVRFFEPQKISSLNVSAYCCAIAPYDLNVKYNQYITVSNRMFSLLAKGLPMVFPNMSSLIDAPNTIIRKSADASEFLDNISYFRKNFYDIQADIEFFLHDHYAHVREE